MITCETLRQDGADAITIADLMGLSQRQVHYQWKLARKQGLYRVPTENLEHHMDLLVEARWHAIVRAEELMHKINMARLARRSGYWK